MSEQPHRRPRPGSRAPRGTPQRGVIGWHQIPNAICIARVVVVFAGLIVVGHSYRSGQGWPVGWFLVIIAAALTDRLDGFLAKRYGWTSALGAFLDQISDKLVTLAMFAFVTVLGGFPWWAMGALVFRELFVSGLRIAANLEGISIPTSEAGRFKTFTQQVAVLPIFLHWAFPAGVWLGQSWAQISVWIGWLIFWAILGLIGRRAFRAFYRVYTVRREAADGSVEIDHGDLVLFYLTIALMPLPIPIAGPAVVLTITVGTGLTYFASYLWARRRSADATRTLGYLISFGAAASASAGFVLVLHAEANLLTMWLLIGVLSALWTLLLSASYVTSRLRGGAEV